MDDQTVYLYLGVALILALLIFEPEFIRNNPLWRIFATINAQPAKDKVKIAGKTGEKTFLSPITRTPCVAFKIEVEVMKDLGGIVEGFVFSKYLEMAGSLSPNHWTKISKEPFEVMTETGAFQVYPSSAVWEVSVNADTGFLDSAQRRALQTIGVETTHLSGIPKNMRVKEYVIRPRQEVIVIGNLHLNGEKMTISSVGDGILVIYEKNE